MSKSKVLALGLVGCMSMHLGANAKKGAKVSKTIRPEDMCIVNIEKAMRESKQGADAQVAVEAKQKHYSELAKKEQDRLMLMKQEVEQKGSMLSAEALNIKQNAFQQEQRAFQQNVQSWDLAIRSEMETQTQAMMKDIKDAAITLAKNDDKAVVIDEATGQVLYLREDKDSTGDLVSLLNNSYDIKLAQKKKEEATVLAQAEKDKPGIKKAATA